MVFLELFRRTLSPWFWWDGREQLSGSSEQPRLSQRPLSFSCYVTCVVALAHHVRYTEDQKTHGVAIRRGRS